MRQYLNAHQIQASSQITLDEVVDPVRMRNIKAQESHPEIRLYSIGHEGQADLHLPGIGAKTFTWIQAAVRAIKDKVLPGTAVFDRHDPSTNSHEGRMQIGEVVGTIVKEIGGRLNTLAAIYVYPAFKSRPLDIASFEAEIEFDHDGEQAWPTSIKHVSGIALSNSDIDSPGFPGATLLGAVQAYVQAFGDDFGGSKMNLSEVKAAVKDLGVTPTQIFGVDTIMGDSAVVEKVKAENANVFNMSKRLVEERDDARKRVVTLENENAEANKKLKQHTVQSKSVTVLDAMLANPELKIDDKAKTFVKRNFKTFSTSAENEDALKVDMGKFVEESVKEYGELAKDVFGVEVKADPTKDAIVFKLPPELTVGGQEPAPTQTPAQPTATRDEQLAAEMDPKTNPLIAGGKAAEEALKT